MSGTTARPTFLPARGGYSLRDGHNAPQFLYSTLDLPAHKKLKLRQVGQSSKVDIKLDILKERLKLSETAYKKNKAKQDEAQDEKEKQDDQDDIIVDYQDDDSSIESDKDSDGEEDDTADLLRQLEAIKKERAAEKTRLEQAMMDKEQVILEEQAKNSNPLLSNESGLVKRRWDEDVVFRNKGGEVKMEKKFVNDMLRSDFHRKFMSKYIK